MNNFLRWAAGTLVLAVVVHLAVILSYPWTAMHRLMGEIEKQAGGVNRAIYPERADHTSRRVVRPSPDLLYALCVYDVSRGPVLVRAPVADTYWSLSFFSADSDNFHVISEAPRGEFLADVILAAQGTDVSDTPYPMITPPTTRGIALYRMLIDSEQRLPMLAMIRNRMGCGPYLK